MKRLIETLFRPIREHGFLFLFYILLSWFLLYRTGWNILPRLHYPIFGSYLLCVAATLLQRIRLGWTVTLCTCLLVFAELICLTLYGSLFSVRIALLIAETNTRESSEFMHSLLTRTELWRSLAYTLLFIAAIAIIIWGIRRLMRNLIAVSMQFGLRLIILLIVLVSAYPSLQVYKKLVRTILDQETSVAINRYGKGFYTPATRLAFGLAFNRAAAAETAILAQTIQHLDGIEVQPRCPLVVLIIGESYNKHHTPLYEPYELMTTPHLCRLQQDSSLVAYTDIVSPSNTTSLVLKRMFSLWTEKDADSWVRHPLFTSVFKQAGFNVHLLTNQFSLNDNEDFNQMGGTIFNIPALSRLQYTDRNDTLYEFDEELIRLMPDTAKLTQRPTLLIVHLMGQHVDYASRYPASHEHFTPDSITPRFDTSAARIIPAQYANATLYNDSVVSALWDKVKNLDAVGIYLSDHGEECFDWRPYFERTSEGYLTADIAHYQFEVPYLFLMSDRFQKNHPELALQIRDAKDRPGMNCDVSHVLLYLAGIEIKDYDATLNILSPEYNLQKRRYIGNHFDYDSLMSTLNLPE